jgi:hypothetical protein
MYRTCFYKSINKIDFIDAHDLFGVFVELMKFLLYLTKLEKEIWEVFQNG